MQNDLRRIQYRARRGAQVVRKHASKQIPDAFRPLRVLPDRFREHMIDCLIEPDATHAIQAAGRPSVPAARRRRLPPWR